MVEEEGDLQEVWIYFYLEGMAPYSYSFRLGPVLGAIVSSSSDVSAM